MTPNWSEAVSTGVMYLTSLLPILTDVEKLEEGMLQTDPSEAQAVLELHW